jgi:drug/metabolite transporter (DMT)-like permease
VSPSVVFPLFAALIYTAGAVLVKRSAELGVGVWRTAFVANIVAALVFQPLLLFGGVFLPQLWWQPAIVAVCYVAGQWLTFTSLDQGDVSVATPVLGLKIVLVATLLTVFRGETLRWQLWAAALLATAGIALLHRGAAGRVAPGRVGRTILTAGLAATAYAIFDVLVQTWSPAWGAGRFVPVTLGMSGLLSCVFILRFRAPLREIPPAAWPWLLGGALALSVQSLLFVSTIANWGNAAAANVVYASRGLWSVLFIWILGHWVSSREQALGARVLGGRLAGAVLMLSAIALVLL